MYKALVVDDVKLYRDNLKSMLATHCPEVEVVKETESVAETRSWLEENATAIDVAFLDIELGDGHVFTLLQELQDIDFDIIFVTGEKDKSIEANFYSSLGFVPKPINADHLKRAVKQLDSTFARSARSVRTHALRQEVEILEQQRNNPNAFRKMSVPTQDGIRFIDIPSILRLESEDNYTHIYVRENDTIKKITASKTIKFYEDALFRYNFFRVHKRHVVNMNWMHNYSRQDGGFIEMVDGKRIDISRRRRPEFIEILKKTSSGF